MEWETVIGLEIHTQLRTKSKIFSGAATAYGAEPNTQACAVDIALPGVLPVMNLEAAKMAVKFGLAIGAKINQTVKTISIPTCQKAIRYHSWSFLLSAKAPLPLMSMVQKRP